MKSNKKFSIMRKFGLILWAWATLILCFVLVLIINHMISEGRDPLAALQGESDAFPENIDTPDTVASSLGTRDILLYFASSQGKMLATETALIEYAPRTVENCRTALQSLIAGPKQEFLLPLMPDQSSLRGLYLRTNGELVIDLSTEMLLANNRPRSTEMEALMVFGIVNTMMQPPLQGEDGLTVKQVRFLFDGGAPQEIFPAHIDLSEPLAQDRRWVQAGYE